MARGFINLEYLIVLMIYLLYFGVMTPLSRTISAITGWSSGLILLMPVSACHLSACLWLVLRLFWAKKPEAVDTSGCAIFFIGSGLLAILTVGAALFGIIFKLGTWIGWWH